jgi:uncharacterized protein with HEPN domain
MKTDREYTDYLKDILDAIKKVEQFVEGMDFEKFSLDSKTIFAVIRALEIIGEASKKIPETAKRHNLNLPWREMAGIRDKLIHEYFGMDLRVVMKIYPN